jgi:hypothetical protein
MREVVTVDGGMGSHMSTETDPSTGRTELAELRNEFALVRLSLDERGNGPRLLVEDLETGAEILLSPLELSSLCLATPEDRVGWLRVGHYRDERERP